MLSAIYVVLINIVTDMVPYFSILELKFIDIFTTNSHRRRREGVTGGGQEDNNVVHVL